MAKTVSSGISGGSSISVGGGAASYSGGNLDAEYDGMTFGQSIRHLQGRSGGGVVVSRSKFLDNDIGVSAIKGVDGILSDFPILTEGNGIKVGVTSEYKFGGAIAHARVHEMLRDEQAPVEFNKHYAGYGDHEWFTEKLASTERGGFHFPNNTAGAVAAHELGHLVEAKVCRKLGEQMGGTGDNATWAAQGPWRNGVVARDIVGNAARKLGLTKTAGRLTAEEVTLLGKAHISGYAGSDVHETVAEAFGDVFANGNNASKLSRAIYSEAKNVAASHRKK